MRAGLASILLLLAAGGLAPAEEASPLEELLFEHRGKIVVLNFWAAWCGPCKKELPLLARLRRDYQARGVEFIGASTDAPEEREEAEALLARSGVTYPVVFGLSDAEMRRLGLGTLLPATAVFDRDGSRVFRIVGEVTGKRLDERLEFLLGERAERPPRELHPPPGIDATAYGE